MTFLNYWMVTAMSIVRPRKMDDQLTRGGPVVQRAAQTFWDFQVMSDTRKAINFYVEPNVGCGDGSLHLGVQREHDGAARPQRLALHRPFVGGRSHPVAVRDDHRRSDRPTEMYGNRYVFAFLRQKTLAMDTRLAVTFTPTLTLELYLQPLVASGAYTAFHEFDRPRSLARSTYGVDRGHDHGV